MQRLDLAPLANGPLTRCEPRPLPAWLTPPKDSALCGVLLIWTACWLAQAVYIDRYTIPLPWCDDFALMPQATGNAPVSREWLWKAQNEHRQPLLRLVILLMGRLTHWNLAAMHQLGLAAVALGALALVLAARSIRGHSSISDSFLCLVALTPAHIDTLLFYVYANAVPMALMCVCMSACMARWPLQSALRLWAYFIGLVMLILFGGPVGSLWALGLCSVTLLGWLERKSVSWRISAVAGTLLVGATAVMFILTVPHVNRHQSFASDSVPTFLKALAKFSVGWLGQPILHELWPWPLLAVALAGLSLASRIGRDLWQVVRARNLQSADLTVWLDLVAALASASAVAAIMAYGRGKYPGLWDSRYVALLLPIPVLTYFLFVRLGAKALAGGMAVCMALVVGWDWPDALMTARTRMPPAQELLTALNDGKVPISILAAKYGEAVGCGTIPHILTAGLLQLRAARLAIFHNDRWDGPGLPPRPLALFADRGTISGTLQRVDDADAASSQSVLSTGSGPESGGHVDFAFETAVPATYAVWARVAQVAPGRKVELQIDERPPVEPTLRAGVDFLPQLLAPSVSLPAGKHQLTVALRGPSLRLDLVELVPAPAGSEAASLKLQQQGLNRKYDLLTVTNPQPAMLAGQPRTISLTSPFSTVRGIEVLLSTGRQVNPGRVMVELLDEQGRTLDSATVDAARLVDNQFQSFPFQAVTGAKGRILGLRLSYQPPAGQSGLVFAWTHPEFPSNFMGRLVGE